MFLAHLWAFGRSAETDILLHLPQTHIIQWFTSHWNDANKIWNCRGMRKFLHQIFGGLANLAPNSGYALHGWPAKNQRFRTLKKEIWGPLLELISTQGSCLPIALIQVVPPAGPPLTPRQKNQESKVKIVNSPEYMVVSIKCLDPKLLCSCANCC